MVEYIDRQAALDMVRGLEERYVNNLPPMIDKADACNALDTLPLADVVEVRHGRWIPIANPTWWGLYECSECSSTSSIDYEWCPNCGAKMK